MSAFDRVGPESPPKIPRCHSSMPRARFFIAKMKLRRTHWRTHFTHRTHSAATDLRDLMEQITQVNRNHVAINICPN